MGRSEKEPEQHKVLQPRVKSLDKVEDRKKEWLNNDQEPKSDKGTNRQAGVNWLNAAAGIFTFPPRIDGTYLSSNDQSKRKTGAQLLFMCVCVSVYLFECFFLSLLERSGKHAQGERKRK